MKPTTILTLILVALTATSNAQDQVWTVGLPGDGWPQDLGIEGGPQTVFVQEAAVNDLPGDPESPVANQESDDDYYFAGVYDIVLDGGDYEPVGEVDFNEEGAERAFAGTDNSLRYHFNLPESLGTAPLTVNWDANNLHEDGGADPRYGVEVYFNGNLIGEETVIRPAELGIINETPAFTLADVNGELGAGYDNYVELRGINYNAEGGGNWMGIDHVSLNQLDPACDPICPPSEIGGMGEVATNVLNATRQNLVFEPGGGDTLPGLGQSWYAVANPGSKDAIDAATASNERAVPYFHAEDGTWWSGSEDILDVQNYPFETDGVITGDNYSVVLNGEILIPESSTIQFLDGVDDFTYLAIDIDRSGTAGDSEGEVIINDNSWTNSLSVANGGAPIVEVDFEGIADDGEWLAMEFAMAEGGGGDHGMLYWDALDEDGIFPVEQGEGVFAEDAFLLQIPDTHLRGPENPPTLVSGEATASVPDRDSGRAVTGWLVDVNPADGTSDQFVTENPDDAVYSTTLDVEDVILHVNPLSDPSDGDSFQVFVADTINGTPTIATEGWTYDSATGSVVFGQLVGCNPDSLGDLDGNGTVEFADFLVLSQNFGSEVDGHAAGDIDCNGTVEFADFLVLSQNFGTTVGGAESVPEPSGLWLMSFAAMFCGLFRRRRS